MADAIAARINNDDYVGRLPSERDLATEFGVAYQTLRHAMQVLRARGLIITRQGCGTFITGNKQRLQDRQPGDRLRSR